MTRALIAGCGYVGSALGALLSKQGFEVFGLRRSGGELPTGVEAVIANLMQPSTLDGLPEGIEQLVYAAGPDDRTDDAYRSAYVTGLGNLLDALLRQGSAVRRVIFVSSTAVYAQGDGEWVDERSPTEPTHFSGVRLLEAERIVRQLSCEASVLRLAGIYGPGRTRLVEQVRRGEARCPSTPTYTNRIHRDDCAAALAHLLSVEDLEPVYVGVDDEPAETCDVLRWLANSVGAPPPPPSEDPESSVDTRRSRSNKRCRNTALHRSGYRFRYPTFREGYAAILAANERAAETRSG